MLRAQEEDPGGAARVPSSAEKPQTTPRQRAVQLACLFFNILSGLTNGYDICVTSTLLDDVVRDLSLCHAPKGGELDVAFCPQKQAVMSLAACGSLGGKLCLAWIADRYGRRCGLALVDTLIVIAVCIEWWSPVGAVFLLGRFLLGVGTGLAFLVTPAYICEIAPQDRRGQFVVMNEVAVCVGCLIGLQVGSSAIGGPGKAAGEEVWRNLLAIAVFPCLLQLAFIFALPESPRWLALHADAATFERAANQLGLTPQEIRDLKEQASSESVPVSQSPGHPADSVCHAQREAWRTNKRAFLLALAISTFVTAAGTYCMTAYAYDILLLCGYDRPGHLLPFIGWAKLVGALLAMALADLPSVGRRRLALFGSSLCFLCDLLLAVSLALPAMVPRLLRALAFMLFIFAWNFGYGSIQFVAVLEILPNEVRSTWSGQIYAITGILEVLLYQVFESLLFRNGAMTFALFAAINLAAVLFSAFLMPDLRGESLEEGSKRLREASADGPGAGARGPIKAAKPVKAHAGGPRRRYGVLEEDGGAAEASPNGTDANERRNGARGPAKLRAGGRRRRYGVLEEEDGAAEGAPTSPTGSAEPEDVELQDLPSPASLGPHAQVIGVTSSRASTESVFEA